MKTNNATMNDVANATSVIDQSLRIIFMGTPVFATSVLMQLIEDQYNIVAVVSQPDKKVGRDQTFEQPPVKQLALAHHIPVLQPNRMKLEYEDVLAYKPDLIVTCAYGQMLPQPLLTVPRFGTVNVHASLLPRLRGGAPIHKAILYGETETGITLMQTAMKMDAGDMYSSRSTSITEEDTMGSLHNRLMGLASEIIHADLPLLLDGKLRAIKQEESEATFAYNISKEEEKIDFSQSLHEIFRHMRALIPSPVSHGIIEGKKVKFWHVSGITEYDDSVVSGTFVGLDSNGIKIKAGQGYIYIEQIQLEGKKVMSAKEFMNGAGRAMIGKRFE